MSKNIIKIKYEDEMKKSYIDYAMSVIISRALPDVRDGLKPVHRRILVEMKELNLSPTSPYRKSARIVGNVLGKLHPHGDSSVYGAMVRMSQDFQMLMPLVDGHGNFGSIDGDSAAAMRYTEARLTPLAMEFLSGTDKGIVDTKPNFDETLQEPVVLPCRYPSLLVNGSTGIAVGMSTNIPSHNLSEVIDASVALLEDEKIDTKGLMKHIKGPDFPTGGIISNKNDLLKIYKEGNGSVRVRADLEVEDAKYGRENIIINEIPYTLSGNKTRIIDDIVALVNDKKLPEITNIFDESSKDGMRIVIELKKGTDSNNTINRLFKMTKLEDTFGVNLLAIEDGQPIVFSLKGMLSSYLKFLKEINVKELNYDLNSYNSRKEIVEGLIEAVDMIDLIIDVIRGSQSVSAAKKCLTKGDITSVEFKTKIAATRAGRLNFTENQANAILTMQLQRLVGLEINKLEKELKELLGKINNVKKILSTDKNLNEYIKKDLLRIKKDYGTNRKTAIKDIKEKKIKKAKMVEEDLYALIDNFNYVKLVDEQSYLRANEETIDGYKKVLPIKNTEEFFVFTSDGEFYKRKATDMPVCKMNEKGVPIEVLMETDSLNKDREVLLMGTSSELESSERVSYVTQNGLSKLVEIDDYYNTNRVNIYATKLNDGDKLIDVSLINKSDKEIEIKTEDRRLLRFMLDEIPTQGRGAKGARAINLNIGDKVNKVKIDKSTEIDKRKRASKGVVLK